MASIARSFVSVAKRNQTLRKIASSTFGEVIFELFAFRLPLQYRMMRIASRSNTLRNVAISVIKRRKRDVFPMYDSTVFRTSPPVENALSELRTKGFCTGIVISGDSLREILNACSQADFVPDGDPRHPVKIDLQSETAPREGKFLYRWINPHKTSAAINQLVHDPYLVKIARSYLGVEPVLNQTHIWWSFPYPGGQEVYTPEYGFHYDIGDYMGVRLFLYLTDVESDCGPHVVIEGTHGNKSYFESTHRRLTDEQAEQRYADKIRVFLGKQGEGFLTDPFGYHKGTNPKRRRCVLQVAYSLTDQVEVNQKLVGSKATTAQPQLARM